MPRLLKNKTVCPPDKFRYVDPDTGHKTEAWDYWSWLDLAKEHRQANNLEVPYDFPARMEDQLCQSIPAEYCQYEKEGTWVNLRLSLGDILTVTKSLLDSALGNYVDQSEAERRASICSRCYFNVDAAGCGACRQISNLVAPGKTTSVDNDLKNCAVCGCYLRPKVHVRLDTLENTFSNARQDGYPSFCWLKQGGINYLGAPPDPQAAATNPLPKEVGE